MRQAATQKRAPVQRRGPHAVRRRRSREQVNQTPEGERRWRGRNVEEQREVGSCLDDPLLLAVPTGTAAPSNAQLSPPRAGSTELAPRQSGLLVGKTRGVGAVPGPVPNQLCSCKQLGFLFWPEVVHLLNGEASIYLVRLEVLRPQGRDAPELNSFWNLSIPPR